MLRAEHFTLQHLRSDIHKTHTEIMGHVDLRNLRYIDNHSDKKFIKEVYNAMQIEMFNAVYGDIVTELLKAEKPIDPCVAKVLRDLLELRDEITKKYTNTE